MKHFFSVFFLATLFAGFTGCKSDDDDNDDNGNGNGNTSVGTMTLNGETSEIGHILVEYFGEYDDGHEYDIVFYSNFESYTTLFGFPLPVGKGDIFTAELISPSSDILTIGAYPFDLYGMSGDNDMYVSYADILVGVNMNTISVERIYDAFDGTLTITSINDTEIRSTCDLDMEKDDDGSETTFTFSIDGKYTFIDDDVLLKKYATAEEARKNGTLRNMLNTKDFRGKTH